MHVTHGLNMFQVHRHLVAKEGSHGSAKLCSCVQALSDICSDHTMICNYSICLKSLCKSLMVILQLSLSYTLCYCGYLQVAFDTGYDNRSWCKSVHFVPCETRRDCHCSSSTSLTSSTADWKTGLLKVVFAPSSEASLTIGAVLLSSACSCPT